MNYLYFYLNNYKFFDKIYFSILLVNLNFPAASGAITEVL